MGGSNPHTERIFYGNTKNILRVEFKLMIDGYDIQALLCVM
jgi:hypothetical protein